MNMILIVTERNPKKIFFRKKCFLITSIIKSKRKRCFSKIIYFQRCLVHGQFGQECSWNRIVCDGKRLCLRGNRIGIRRHSFCWNFDKYFTAITRQNALCNVRLLAKAKTRVRRSTLHCPDEWLIQRQDIKNSSNVKEYLFYSY